MNGTSLGGAESISSAQEAQWRRSRGRRQLRRRTRARDCLPLDRRQRALTQRPAPAMPYRAAPSLTCASTSEHQAARGATPRNAARAAMRPWRRSTRQTDHARHEPTRTPRTGSPLRRARQRFASPHHENRHAYDDLARSIAKSSASVCGIPRTCSRHLP